MFETVDHPPWKAWAFCRWLTVKGAVVSGWLWRCVKHQKEGRFQLNDPQICSNMKILRLRLQSTAAHRPDFTRKPSLSSISFKKFFLLSSGRTESVTSIDWFLFIFPWTKDVWRTIQILVLLCKFQSLLTDTPSKTRSSGTRELDFIPIVRWGNRGLDVQHLSVWQKAKALCLLSAQRGSGFSLVGRGL